jgi:hypothetical protein
VAIFFEGARVEWAAGGHEAEGHIVAVGSNSAHVKWSSGPDKGHITFTDLYDIEPVTAKVKEPDDPLHLTAVRRAYDSEEEIGVLNFLATQKYLGSWQAIAQDVLAYAEERIRTDASMELVEEQLTTSERNKVVTAAALTLLKDAFGEEEG